MSILRINSTKPTVKRPLRAQDIQNVWQGMQDSLAIGTTGNPKIISGFDVNGTSVTKGVIAFNEKLWLYDGSATLGQTLRVAEIAANDPRIFSDGTTNDFSFQQIASTTNYQGSVAVGVVTVDNIQKWRKATDYLQGGVYFEMSSISGFPTSIIAQYNASDVVVTNTVQPTSTAEWGSMNVVTLTFPSGVKIDDATIQVTMIPSGSAVGSPAYTPLLDTVRVPPATPNIITLVIMQAWPIDGGNRQIRMRVNFQRR